MTLARLTVSLIVAIVLAATVSAGDLDDVKKLLAHPIITPDIPQKEVEDFCDAHIPRMPKLTTAEAWQQEADRMRKDVLDNVVFRGEAAAWREAKTKVEWAETIED